MFKVTTSISRNTGLNFLNGLATHARSTRLLAGNTSSKASSRGVLPPLPSDAKNAEQLNQTREEMLTKIANIPSNPGIEIDQGGEEFSNAVDDAYSKALPGGYGHS